MDMHAKLWLFLVLSAGCSAGAAAGTSGPTGSTPADASTSRADAGLDDEEEEDAGELDGNRVEPRLDGSRVDASTRDATRGDPGGALLDAAKDVSVDVYDAKADAPLDAAKDAPADVTDGAIKDAAQGSADAGPLCAIDDGTWVGATSQYHIVSKGTLWRISATGALVSSTPLASIPGMAKGPCLGQAGTCHIDALTWRNDLAEYHIVHGGKLWRLDEYGELLGSSLLTAFSGLATGPCLGKGLSCTFEAGAWRSDLDAYQLVQDGIIYSVTEAGALLGSSALTSIPGVATGPCAGQIGTCRVDAFTYRPDKAQSHVIAKGTLYIIDNTGDLVSATPLSSFSGFANGACK